VAYGQDMQSVVAAVAAVVSLVSLLFIWLQVNEMRRQTSLQRQIAEDAAQPYVWADVRIQQINGLVMEFVLGNSGHTVATEVVVSVDPPFPRTQEAEHKFVEAMHAALDAGISYLPPGREMTWSIGTSPLLVNREGPLVHHVRIQCKGPFGAVAANEYDIDFAGMRETVAVHSGSLRDVARSIDKAVDRLARRMGDDR
jgi:hypothetical protein